MSPISPLKLIYDLSNTDFIKVLLRYEKESEKKAIGDLNTFLSDESLCVEDCGLFVDMHTGFLAASPDGTVGKDGLVEVKCPHV